MFRADVSLRDVTIAHIGSGVTKCGWRHAQEERGGFLGDFEKVTELRWDLPRGKTVDFRLLAETFVAGATCVRGGWWKSRNRKIEPLSAYVEERLNSKVIKSFVPEQIRRYVFFEFRDSYVLYIYIWTSNEHFAYSCIIAMVHWDDYTDLQSDVCLSLETLIKRSVQNG